MPFTSDSDRGPPESMPLRQRIIDRAPQAGFIPADALPADSA